MLLAENRRNGAKLLRQKFSVTINDVALCSSSGKKIAAKNRM